MKLDVNSHSFPPILVSCSFIVEVAPPSSSASVQERFPLPPETAADTPFHGPVDDTATVSPLAFTSFPVAVPEHDSGSLPACFAPTAELVKLYCVPFVWFGPSAGENFALPSTKHLPPDSLPFWAAPADPTGVTTAVTAATNASRMTRLMLLLS